MLLARAIFGNDALAQALAGIAAVVGHTFSPYIGLKGGRGVTTGLGGLLVLSPPAAGAGLLLGLTAIAATRYVSLGSVLGTAAGSLVLLVQTLQGSAPVPFALFAVVVGVFIVVAHRDNIDRLLHGTERKLGQKATTTEEKA